MEGRLTMKLFKTTSLLSYLIILSLIFTSVIPAFANEDIMTEIPSDADVVEEQEIPYEYSPDNHDSIAYDGSRYESPEEITLPQDGDYSIASLKEKVILQVMMYSIV